MDSWDVELKSGRSFDVHVRQGKYLYLTQASLGKSRKETKKSACLQITIDGKKHVLATLHPKRRPQQDFDLVFDRDFQISHNWRYGTVCFSGYEDRQPGYKLGVSEVDTNSNDDEDNVNEEDVHEEDGDDFFEDVDEEDGTPPKKQSGKKRPKAAASKTPCANKKAKKTATEGKEAGVATPRPSEILASDGAPILKPCKRHTSK